MNNPYNIWEEDYSTYVPTIMVIEEEDDPECVISALLDEYGNRYQISVTSKKQGFIGFIPPIIEDESENTE